MNPWIGLSLDVTLILLVGVGLVQAARLIRHLEGLRQGRVEMEQFVREFNATVMRAEAGIKGLRQAARDSGDDLEKLVEKALLIRDELHFIVESADQVASRLSQGASTAMRPSGGAEKSTAASPPPAPTEMMTPFAAKNAPENAAPTSRAEKELLQALKKLG
jgi:uncharacterized protein DUF6468